MLFACDGVPPVMMMDGLKRQTQDEFNRKARESGCPTKTVKVHSQWINAAEGAIRELKRGTSGKMVRTKSPK